MRLRTSRAELRALSWARMPGSTGWAAVTVFVVAFAARVIPLLRGGGLGSDVGYDSSVYYAAGDGLVHGRMPYRDFVLLHPPGIMLALAPFAAVGRLTSDHAGFILACLAFTGIGSLNAVMVMAVARKLGTSRAAAFWAGLFAAVWIGSIRAEYLTRLEPLADLFVLIGLYAYASARRRPAAWTFAVLGAALAAATSVKIWYAVPLIVMAGWIVVRVRSRSAITAFAAGTAVAVLAIDGPFFALAPSQMWQMVVAEQLGRHGNTSSPFTRLDQLIDFNAWSRSLGVGPAAVVAVALVLVLAALVVAASRQPGGRPVAILLGVQLVVLAAAPSWFSFYSDYLTPALAVSVALGLDGVLLGSWRTVAAIRQPRLQRCGSAVVAVVALLVLLAPAWWQRAGIRFPGNTLAAEVAGTRCVMSDSPMGLIELNALSRSFVPGCRDWVDVTGRTYGVDAMNTARAKNSLWQRDVKAYLLSGNAFILVRDGTGLSAKTRAELRGRPVLARAGSFAIYRGRSTRQ